MRYSQGMPFSAEVLTLLRDTIEVEIETHARNGSVHRTIVWVVVDGPDAFVRSYRGATARWYREALAAPDVAIHAGGRRIPVRATPATDDASIARASAGLAGKYADDPATPAMLRADVLGTTMRLDPGRPLNPA